MEDDFNPESPEWYIEQKESHQEALRLMMASVQAGTTSIEEFTQFLLDRDIVKIKERDELRRVPPRSPESYTMGVDPYSDATNLELREYPRTINESFNPEDREMKRKLLQQLQTSSLKVLYEMLGYSRIPAENERVQYINQISNHSYDQIKKLCEGEIKRIEEETNTREYLTTLSNEELLTVLDRIGANYSNSVFTREEVSDFLVLNVRLSSIKDAIINFDYEDEEKVAETFERFVKRRTLEECTMLLNMIGWHIDDIDESDVKGLKGELLIQDYKLVYNFYLQLTK